MEKNLPTPEVQPVPTMLSIALLQPDPHQPRKSTNKQKDEELAASIQSEGILQSILVRPMGKQFMIVCGHRRYEAALKAGLAEVPVIIRSMNDQQALLRQHIENIQREGVNLMEQAKGFLALVKSKELTITDIAIKIGKSEYFVRQQLELNKLTEKWQHMFYMGALSVSIALEIASLPVTAQEELYKNNVRKCDEEADAPRIDISTWQINKYKGFLHQVAFDLADASLLPKVGACTSCTFNSACGSLFPGDENNPRCNNLPCLQQKSSIHLQMAIDKSLADPDTILVYEGYEENKMVQQLKAKEHPVLKIGSKYDCSVVPLPQQPTEQAFIQQAMRLNKKLSLKQAKKQFDEAMIQYQDKLAFVEKKVLDGVYKKALVVYDQSDANTGKYIYIQLNDKTNKKKANTINLKDDNVEPATIQQEIDRINAWYDQSLISDSKAIHLKIAEAFKEQEKAGQLPYKILQSTTAMVNFLLMEMLSYSTHPKAQKIIKNAALWKTEDREKYFKALATMNKQQQSCLVNLIIGEKYVNSLPHTLYGFVFRKLADELNCLPIKQIIDEQQQKTTARLDRTTQRIDGLKKRKTMLQKVQASEKTPSKSAKVISKPATHKKAG